MTCNSLITDSSIFASFFFVRVDFQMKVLKWFCALCRLLPCIGFTSTAIQSMACFIGSLCDFRSIPLHCVLMELIIFIFIIRRGLWFFYSTTQSIMRLHQFYAHRNHFFPSPIHSLLLSSLLKVKIFQMVLIKAILPFTWTNFELDLHIFFLCWLGKLKKITIEFRINAFPLYWCLMRYFNILLTLLPFIRRRKSIMNPINIHIFTNA